MHTCAELGKCARPEECRELQDHLINRLIDAKDESGEYDHQLECMQTTLNAVWAVDLVKVLTRGHAGDQATVDPSSIDC